MSQSISAQVVGVLVLLAAGQADGTTLKQGIVGDDHIEPYNIVIIFMSQARRVARIMGIQQLTPRTETAWQLST